MTQRALDFIDGWIARNILASPGGNVQRVHGHYSALIDAGELAGIPKTEMDETFCVPGALLGWVFTEIVFSKYGRGQDALKVCNDLVELHGRDIFELRKDA